MCMGPDTSQYVVLWMGLIDAIVGIEPCHEGICGGGGRVDGDAAGALDGFGFVFFEDAHHHRDAFEGFEDLDGVPNAAH